MLAWEGVDIRAIAVSAPQGRTFQRSRVLVQVETLIVSPARRTLLFGLFAALALLGGGCGGDETSEPTPPPETAQELPKLPKRWQEHRDRSIGYAIGKPPGWRVGPSRMAALIRSPDHLVAVTIVANRDREALEVPLEQFATDALAALPGFKARLEPSRPKPFSGTPLDAVWTTATGTTVGRGIQERATLLVLRREDIVNYTVAVVENAQRGYSRKDREVALRMIGTLRDLPPKNGGSSSPPGG
jgi:hypothetical protein